MQSPPLWQQLLACSAVIQAVRKGQSGTAAMDAVAADLRPGVQALAFAVWRNLGCAQVLRKLIASRASSAPVDALLCTGLAILGASPQDGDPRYDEHTFVNQLVEAAKREPATRAQGAFINGCMRRFLRERTDLMHQAMHNLEARFNHPLWWIERIRQDHPQNWKRILAASNSHAGMTLRINTRKIAPLDYAAALTNAGIEAHRWDSTIYLKRPVPVGKLPGFAKGWVSVQDGAAQRAAPLLLGGLPLHAGSHILDACAAPGGKTAHLRELSDARVMALDINPARATRISESLHRLGLEAQICIADAAKPQTWWDGTVFDAVLLDAPCTASGIVRRHPDIRWLRRPSDIAQLAGQQKQLLQTLWPLVRPGGRLLYCTCSIFHAEGQDQIQAFLKNNSDARLLPSPGHLLPHISESHQKVSDNSNHAAADSIPNQDLDLDQDGFYYALLEKSNA